MKAKGALVVTCLFPLACATGAGASRPGPSPTPPIATTPSAAASPPASAHVTTDGLPPAALMSALGASATGGILGTWAYAAGTTTRTCPGEAGTDAPPEGVLVTAAGGTASEVVVSEPGACALRFSLAGATAAITPGQTCAGPDGAGGMITFADMTWTLTLAADGETLAESLAADETLAPARGAPRTCKFTETGVTLRRP